MSIPAERILLRMEGQPQEAAEAYALVLVTALKFCAQPETFPVFMAFTQADNADPPWAAEILATLDPGILRGIEGQIAAGIVADFMEASQ